MDNKQIELKDIGGKEIKNTFSWLLNSEFRKLFLMQEEPVWDKHVAYFEKVKKDVTQKIYAIYLGENHIGNCGFKYIKNQTGELWIYIGDSNYRGKHLAKPICRVLINKGQEEFGINEIYLHVAKINKIAIGLYESLGFELAEINDEDVKVWGDRIDSILKYKLNIKTTKVAMMQPSFLPWQGLFELIYQSDKFIFLDDFQFVVQSHHTRNKLFINMSQVGFYCVPVQKNKCFESKLNETLLVENNIWKTKILKRLQNIYCKTNYYKNIYPQLEQWLLKDYKTLAELNIACIKTICDILKINSQFLYSSDFTKETCSSAIRTQRVCELFDWARATTYLSAFGSFEYMENDNYDYKKYPVLFQNYIPKYYKQYHAKEFVPYLSILDALFNIGGEKTLELIKNGTEKWLSWDERNRLSN